MSGGIIRAPRSARYEIVPAVTIEDSQISYRALGVLVRLLRLPDGASIAADSLAKGRNREGRAAIRTAIRELRDAGYVRQIKRQNVHGHWITERWVYDTRSADATEDRKPVIGGPVVGNLVAKSSKSTTVSKTEAVAPRPLPAPSTRLSGVPEMIAGIETWNEGDRIRSRAAVEAHGEVMVQTAASAVVARGERPLPSRVLLELANMIRARKQSENSQASPLRELKAHKQRISKADPKRIDEAFRKACDAMKKKT